MVMVGRNEVLAAAERISGVVEETPLIAARLGGHSLWLKCENRQFGGAFKVTKGFLDKFGPRRVVDTPITELGFAASVGLGASAGFAGAAGGIAPASPAMTILPSAMKVTTADWAISMTSFR